MQFRYRWKNTPHAQSVNEETVAQPRGASRCLRYGWFVAIVTVVRLLVEPEGEASAQGGVPSVSESDDAGSDIAPDPGATTA